MITRRYKSPIIVRELSESQKHKYLSKKTKNKQILWKIVSKGLEDKTEKNTFYKKYLKKINKNPFTLNNHKIKTKINYNKNKTPLKFVANINIDNNNFSILNKSKITGKNNHPINQVKYNNTCYSKENIHYTPNLLYKINSPKNQNNKYKFKETNNNNKSINIIDAKPYPIINSLKHKCHNNSNKKIYHRNLNHFNISNTNNTNFTNNN